MIPTECKFCGCGDIERQSPIMQSLITTFACGTMSDTEAGETRWLRDQRCAGPVGRLYKRIRQALNVLRVVDRYDTDNVDPDTWCGDEVSQAVDADIVDQVIQILEGGSDATD